MNCWKFTAYLLVPFIIVLTGMVSGCGGGETTPAMSESVTGQRLLQVYKAYEKYIQEKKESPKQPEDLHPYLTEFGEPSQIMTSERDGQSFVIKWGVKLGAGDPETESGSGAGIILAREVEGKDGVIYTVRGDGSLYERDKVGDEGEDEENLGENQ